GIWHAGTTVPTYGFLERDLGCSHVTNPGVPDRQASVGPDQVANLNRVQDRINTGMDEPAAQRHPEISKIAKVVSVPFLGHGEDAIEREGHALQTMLVSFVEIVELLFRASDASRGEPPLQVEVGEPINPGRRR